MHDTITHVSPSASSIDGLAASAWEDVGASFDRFCLMAGIASLRRMMEEDAEQAAGRRCGRDPGAPGHRWGTAVGTLGFQGGRVAVERPRVRDNKSAGREIPLPSWEEFRDRGHLDEWAASLMLASVPARKFGRALRHPETGVPAGNGSGMSRPAVWRRFKALTEEKFAEWMSSDISRLDLLVIQIDGLHLAGDLLMIGAVGVDSGGKKHPLGVAEGATENAAAVQALLDNLIGRGLDPSVCRLFVLDGAKALSCAVRRTFGAGTPVQRCRVHKGRNITERLPRGLHGSVKRTLRQAWELDGAAKAERLIRNLARRLELEAPGVSKPVLEGLDEILTVNRLGLPEELRRSLATTNMIESPHAVVRQVCRNVKRWRNAGMALRWIAAGMQEAGRGMRRLRAFRQLPHLKAALERHQTQTAGNPGVEAKRKAA